MDGGIEAREKKIEEIMEEKEKGEEKQKVRNKGERDN